jgi:hypothetical protein
MGTPESVGPAPLVVVYASTPRLLGAPTPARALIPPVMMMSFVCSCRNKNRSRAPYTFRKVLTRLFRGPSTNDVKK